MIPSFADDSEIKRRLYPFAELRTVADIRIGILTIREKWHLIAQKFGLPSGLPEIPPNIIPSMAFVNSMRSNVGNHANLDWSTLTKTILHPWQLFEFNDWALREDYQLVTAGRYSEPIPETVDTIKSTSIFVEEGARLNHCTLNASTGPIYIGKNSEIMEGALIRGPFALCEGAVIKMGAKIYGATTIGPFSVAGGEIKNSILFGYSNKAHDGYLGDSVIGEWCNLGAGTSNSNLRNTASFVKVWDRSSDSMQPAGLKCGLLMGDYSRSAINTSFNTATVVGTAAHVFGNGLTPKYIADFSWGQSGDTRYNFEKAIEDIGNWKKLKNKELTEKEIQILKGIFETL